MNYYYNYVWKLSLKIVIKDYILWNENIKW